MPEILDPMKDINLPIPTELLEANDGHSINFNNISGKKVVGLIGYAGSGKDAVAKFLVDNFGYTKIKFGDILKNTLNTHFKEIVAEDLINRGESISYSEIDFLEEDDRVIKEKLRPYMIWLGETLRAKNGVFFWINRALESLKDDQRNIVIADVRRTDELELFKNSNSSKKTLMKSMGIANCLDKDMINNLSTVDDYIAKLFLVNQFGLEDKDELTVKAILNAQKDWLIDDTIMIDSRIPEEGVYRDNYMRVVSLNLSLNNNL